MKNTIKNIIRYFLLSNFALLLLAASNSAAPLVRTATGTQTTNLSVAMAFFRQDLGGTNHPDGGSYITGRREINWEDHNFISNYNSSKQFVDDYYNKIQPRGIVFNTEYNNSIAHPTMMISHASGNDPNGYAWFTDTSGEFLAKFKPFSGKKMFGSVYSNSVSASFYIPGTKIPATVKGLGLVFAGVDRFDGALITLYDESDKVIYADYVPKAEDGFSFVGISFNDGTRIARVDIKLGTKPLFGGVVCQNQSECDYAALDDVIFAEPRAREYHRSDFDGDGTADYAVFRPSTGGWYIINSGTNTFTAMQFGTNGDVPVDGDFDGDSRSDLTVFRPSTGSWYTLRSSDNKFQATQFGTSGDKPVAADYDKDGITDIAVWRAADGNYYSLNSSDGKFKSTHFGQNGDIPIGSSAVQ